MPSVNPFDLYWWIMLSVNLLVSWLTIKHQNFRFHPRFISFPQISSPNSSANPNRRIDNGPLPWRAEIYGLLSPLLPLSIVRSRDEGSLSLESRKRRCGCCHHYSVMSCKESRRRVAAVGEPRTTVWLLPPLLSLCHVKSHNEGPLPLESRERRCRHCHHCSHGLLWGLCYVVTATIFTSSQQILKLPMSPFFFSSFRHPILLLLIVVLLFVLWRASLRGRATKPHSLAEILA